jgi:hypothetical protein
MLVLVQDGGSYLRIFTGPTEGSERSPNKFAKLRRGCEQGTRASGSVGRGPLAA